MCLGLVKGNVCFIDFVVKVVLENAAGAGRVPFLCHELHLLQNWLLVYLHHSISKGNSDSSVSETYGVSLGLAATENSTAGLVTAIALESALPVEAGPAAYFLVSRPAGLRPGSGQKCCPPFVSAEQAEQFESRQKALPSQGAWLVQIAT